jgi:preprotein translocase subunit YajC
MLSALAPAWVLFAAEAAGPGNQCMMMLPTVAGAMILFYFLILRPQQRDRQRRDQLLKNLKKNDKVVTIGGIIGIVANVSPDSPEVILKVDETTNTKLKVLRSSIHEVITDKDQKVEPPESEATKP